MKNFNESSNAQTNAQAQTNAFKEKFTFNADKSQFGGSKFTFKELKSKVAATGETKLPTRKQLTESGCRVFMKRRVDADTELTVYENGFALYEKRTGEDEVTATIFGVDRCGSVTYDSVGKIDDLDKKYFEDEDCLIRLVIEGENRIEHNCEKVHNSKRSFAISGDGSDWSVADESSKERDEEAAKREKYKKVREAMKKLTNRQREIVTMYVVKGMKQREISNKLGISQQVVDRTIKAGLKNLKKFF